MQLIPVFLLISCCCFGQIETPEINSIQRKIDALEESKEILKTELEAAKLNWIQRQIKKIGVPSSDNIEEVIVDSSSVKGQSQPIIVHSKNNNKSKPDKTSAA